jgi:hypothetical protein
VGSLAVIAYWTTAPAAIDEQTLELAGLATLGFGVALALLALMAALAQMVWAHANRRSTALPGSALLLAILVLGGSLGVPVVATMAERSRPQNVAGMGAYAVPITAPWATMNLPTRGGTALYSDPTTLTLIHGAGQGAALAASYDQRLRALGWTSTYTNNSAGMWMTSYSNGTQASLTFVAMDQTTPPASTVVSLVSIP